VTRPAVAAGIVDEVVERELGAGADVPQGDHVDRVISEPEIRVRIAAVIQVAIRAGHEEDASVDDGAVLGSLPSLRAKRRFGRDLALEREPPHDLAGDEGFQRERAETGDRRFADRDFRHRESLCLPRRPGRTIQPGIGAGQRIDASTARKVKPGPRARSPC
jgi:hypothetical protein